MKKIIAVFLAALLFISSVLFNPFGRGDEPAILAAEHTFNSAEPIRASAPAPFSIEDILSEQESREGYILAPTMFGLSGIDTLSSFVLRTPTADAPQISIDGQPEPTITREDGNTYIITPSIPLTPNSVYVLRLSRGGTDITWAFQTAVNFEITSTLPRNQSTNVPVRTGIEVSFSYGEEIDISKNFAIYPAVEGRFIHRDSTAVFMPISPLKHAQVYTVTISAGIVPADHVFSFETEPAPDAPRQDWSSRIHFNHSYAEFPTFTAPTVYFWLNYNWSRRDRPPIEMKLYSINDREQAINAVNKLGGARNWSFFSSGEHLVDTSDFTNVFTTVIRERQNSPRWNESFTFPENLPEGFYLLNAKTEDSDGHQGQMVIQITDLAIQVIADEEKSLFWINDMNTGSPVSAKVFDPIGDKSYDASRYGIAVIERKIEFGEFFIITADETESILFPHWSGTQHFWQHWHHWDMYDDYIMPMPRVSARSWNPWGSQNSNSQYWTALQLDRTLFQRDDTLSLWGFVQNRRSDENITFVTVVLTEASWHRWHWDSLGNERDTLQVQNIPVTFGAYSDEIRLPNLDTGSYEIAVYHGDVLLNSMFFTVMDYVKPPYQLMVSADKQAVFAGEEVNFTARTEFFEGTPVPDLEIAYSFWGSDLRTPNRGRDKTDLDGAVELSATPTASNDRAQGERSLTFSAEAALPEIGWVHEQAWVRVFINDINVRVRASREEKDAVITVNVHDITLDRINDGTSEHWGDYLGKPKDRQRLSVEIVEIYWERVRDGEFYDHVTRQVIPRYRHERRENSLEKFELTTNADGTAERNFTVPDTYRRSYQARVTTTDGNGRTIRHDVFIGRDFTGFFNSANDTRLFLDGVNRDGYDIGDDVELTIMRGAEPVTQGNFLFVAVQDGILSYHIGRNPLKITFGEQHVPNTQVFAYHFNGHTYNTGGQMSARLLYNPANKELVIRITPDKDAYRPGETPTFTITATDLNGNPKAANVNISLVDEALFALMDYGVDTREMLYRNISDNLRFSLATHATFTSDGIDDMDDAEEADFAGGMSYTMSNEGANLRAAVPSASPAPNAVAGGVVLSDSGGGSAMQIRQRFEDTAIFASVRTNAQGEARLSFQLPDNITSWRVTSSAISNDLYAGNAVQSVRVTLPMFLHYTLNNTFLAGDIPTLGVNAYGTSLVGGEQAEFSVWRENAPADIRTATGAAFERVNIPLWEMTEEGFGALIISAKVSNIHNDAVRHEYQVINSHRLVDNAIFYDTVTPQTAFDVNTGGLTNITFTDRGRGQFLSTLFQLRHTWWSGARIEALVAKREASALIEKHFPDVRMFGGGGGFDILNYQTERGGISILPYSEAELEVTVMLMPFVKDEVNLQSLRRYLRDIYNTSSTDNKMLALYGLAMLNEPVLLDLQRYALLDNLSVRNTAYIALGFAELGDMHTARDLYTNRIAPHIQRVSPLYRVNAGANRAEIVDATSVTAFLAARLGMPEALGLHNYATNARIAAAQPFDGNRADTQLLNIERLKFITHEIENHTNAAAGITYTLFGETVTRNLGHGGQFTLRIPAQNMHEFNLTSVAGEVSAVSIIRTPLEDMDTVENDLKITREYFRAGTNTRTTTFEQDEIVRVQITVDYSARDITGTYVITDFLPAGLVHVANSARFPADDMSRNSTRRAFVTTEGQRITFHDHNGRFNTNRSYHYYARVINPGTFRAEGTLVQSLGAREYMTAGEDTVLTIR
jgi:hypothetical protein